MDKIFVKLPLSSGIGLFEVKGMAKNSTKNDRKVSEFSAKHLSHSGICVDCKLIRFRVLR